MLQFIISKNERYSIVEQVKTALEADCKWIELNMEGSTSDEAKAAALSTKFKGVTAEELQKATVEIAPIMPKGQLSKSSVNVLVSTLLSQI